MAHSFWLRGDHDRAVEAGQRALSIATGIRDFALQASANYYLGEAYHVLGDYRRAADFLRRNVERFEGDLIHERFGMAGPHSVISRAWLVMCLAELGEFPEGIVRGEEGLRIAEAVDQPFSVALASYAVGSLSLRKGDLIRAISLLERALPLCQSVPYYFPWIASALGYAYALSGRVAEALPIQEQAVQQAASMGITQWQSCWVGWLGEAYLLAGRMNEAAQIAQRALDLSRERKERGYQAHTFRHGHALLARPGGGGAGSAGMRGRDVTDFPLTAAPHVVTMTTISTPGGPS